MLHVQEDHLLGLSSLSCYILYIATSTPFFDPVIGHNVIKSEYIFLGECKYSLLFLTYAEEVQGSPRTAHTTGSTALWSCNSLFKVNLMKKLTVTLSL